jgi:biotin carboxylase
MSCRILLLLPTTTYRTHDFMEAATRLGVEAVVGSDQKQILEEAAPGRTVTLDLRDPEHAADQIVTFAREHTIHAIIPTDEATAEVAAVAAQRLGIRHNPPEAARATHYKDMLRAALIRSGVRTPAFRIVSSSEDPEKAGATGPYPCVLKPTFLSASRGVIRADNPAEFVQALSRIRLLFAHPEVAEKGGGTVRRVLVEEFIPGEEVAVEGLLVDGRLKVLAIFDKPDPLDGPFFAETIYVTPSRLPDSVQKAIEETTAAGARALGLIEGPIHAELRVNDRGTWLLELAARSIGGLCSRTLRFGTGISLEELILRQARGDDIASFERENRPAGVLMLPVPRAGVLAGVAGLEAARAVPGIEDVTLTIPVGQHVEPLPEGSKYLGFVFARGDTPAQVEKALREAWSRIEVTIHPGVAAEHRGGRNPESISL